MILQKNSFDSKSLAGRKLTEVKKRWLSRTGFSNKLSRSKDSAFKSPKTQYDPVKRWASPVPPEHERLELGSANTQFLNQTYTEPQTNPAKTTIKNGKMRFKVKMIEEWLDIQEMKLSGSSSESILHKLALYTKCLEDCSHAIKMFSKEGFYLMQRTTDSLSKLGDDFKDYVNHSEMILNAAQNAKKQAVRWKDCESRKLVDSKGMKFVVVL